MSSTIKKLAVFAPRIGSASEVWILRQLERFRRLRPRAVAWQFHKDQPYPLAADTLDILGYPDDKYQQSWRRWQSRLLNVASGNYYAVVGGEKKRIRQLLEKNRPDVILCHFGHIALKVLDVARELGIPLVAHFHGMDLSSMLQNPWYRKSLLRQMSGVSASVVVGGHQRERLIASGAPADSVHLIPCGAPAKELSLLPALPKTGNVIIGVGRLIEEKGIAYTIRAISNIMHDDRDICLKLLGDGPQLAAMKELAGKLGVCDRIEFFGNVGGETVREQLRRADVFVQHSLDAANGWTEGFGVSITEAMACGLPVVATRCGGIPDQVIDGQTGFLVPQRDVDAMAAAIRTLLDDSSLRATLGRQAQERAVACFDVGGQVEKLEDVLLSVCR